MSSWYSFHLPHYSLREQPSNPWKAPPVWGAAGEVPWCRMWCSLVVEFKYPCEGKRSLLCAPCSSDQQECHWNRQSWKSIMTMMIITHWKYCWLFPACLEKVRVQATLRQSQREEKKTLLDLTVCRLWKVFEQRGFCCFLWQLTMIVILKIDKKNDAFIIKSGLERV